MTKDSEMAASIPRI